jgi:hypothetical protein
MMKKIIAPASSLLLLAAALRGFQAAHGFQISSPSKSSFVALEARNVKRQSLGSILADTGEAVVPTPKRSKKASKISKNDKRKVTGDAGVSSDLASWAASGDTAASGSNEAVAAPTVDEVEAASFAPFVKEKKSERRSRQTERVKVDKKQLEATKKITDQLDQILSEGKNNLEEILSVIKSLMEQEQESMPFKTLVASSSLKSTYRLAWVGSDDAICHIGTGLHKVPLARLQEVFLMLKGKSKLEMYEVISIFGPFPNVRNTLMGSCSVGSSATAGPKAMWKINWESMIDGTGKELAGKDQSQQSVDLQVYFADTNAILAVVPSSDGEVRKDPLEVNGANVLLFIREDDLDEKLDALRAS